MATSFGGWGVAAPRRVGSSCGQVPRNDERAPMSNGAMATRTNDGKVHSTSGTDRRTGSSRAAISARRRRCRRASSPMRSIIGATASPVRSASADGRDEGQARECPAHRPVRRARRRVVDRPARGEPTSSMAAPINGCTCGRMSHQALRTAGDRPAPTPRTDRAHRDRRRRSVVARRRLRGRPNRRARIGRRVSGVAICARGDPPARGTAAAPTTSADRTPISDAMVTRPRVRARGGASTTSRPGSARHRRRSTRRSPAWA